MKSLLICFVAMTLTILPACSAKRVTEQPSLIENPQNGQDHLQSFTGNYLNLMQHTFTFVGEDMDPDLSPDGKTLLYASTSNTRTADIFTKTVNGKSFMQRTYHESNDRFPRWSPDGKWILFASDRSGNWDLYLMPTVTSSAKPIRLTRRHGDELHPSWSPDGTLLCYNYYNARKGDWEIWVFRLADQSTWYLCDGLMPEWCPNPKNNRIVFQRSRERNTPWYGIWTVNATLGKESEQIAIVTESKWAAINPAWSRDGERILFATVYKSSGAKAAGSLFYADDLWIVNSDGEGQQQLTNNSLPEWNPYWAGDDRIYFNRNVGGKKNIWSIQPKLLRIANPKVSQPKAKPQPMPKPQDKDDTEEYTRFDSIQEYAGR